MRDPRQAIPPGPGWVQNLLQPLFLQGAVPLPEQLVLHLLLLLEHLLLLELPQLFGSGLLLLREVISEIMRQPWLVLYKNGFGDRSSRV